MDLSIVIVSWNTRDLLAKCLASIYQYPFSGAFEVLVVDNASSDDSAEMVRQDYPKVSLFANTDNVGFAKANNQAIRHCAGHYILLLNPDTELKADALDQLVGFMEQTPRAGAAGSQLLNADGTMQISCHPELTLGREIWRLLHLDQVMPLAVYRQERWETDRAREVDIIQGASLILRKSALDQVGWLDEDYFIYTEEVDLCYRMKKAGWKLYWVPQSRVIHYGGQSTQQVPRQMFLRLYQSRVLYFRKNHGRLTAASYKAVLFLAAMIRLLFIPTVALSQPSKREYRKNLVGNYRSLLFELPRM